MDLTKKNKKIESLILGAGLSIRMKGVNNEAILDYAFKNYNGDCLKMYEDMFNGKEIEFDLLCGGKKIAFLYNKNGILILLGDMP